MKDLARLTYKLAKRLPLTPEDIEAAQNVVDQMGYMIAPDFIRCLAELNPERLEWGLGFAADLLDEYYQEVLCPPNQVG